MSALAFWFESPDFPERHQPATDHGLDALETQIGQALPKELRAIYKVREGGVSNYSSYENGDVYAPIPAFLRATGCEHGSVAYANSPEWRQLRGVPGGVVMIASGGHEWLGLDFRQNPHEPSVVFQNDEDSPIEQVAPSFGEFLLGLVTD